MDLERIDAALRAASDTKHITIGKGVLAAVDAIFQRSFGDRSAVVVADENTFEIEGQEVQERLQATGRSLLPPYIFPGQPTLAADYRNIVPLRDALQAHQAIPVAVGSGVLNDLVKRAAAECQRPYMVVATAASMDGYTAFGAAITTDGYKQTLPCPAPRAVLADLDILVHAPQHMTASGYGDLLGKVTAGADWLLADALDVEPIDRHVWSMVQAPLRQWIGNSAALQAGDRDAIAHLIEGLLLSGLAMQASKSSRPASGSEHQFSHLWEMEGLGHSMHGEPPLSHGFKVGVGSIAIAALYERVLQRDLDALDVAAICRAWPSRSAVEQAVRAAHTAPALTDAAVTESLAKYISADQLAHRLALLSERWPTVRERVKEQVLAADQLQHLLQAAGCPTLPAEIGLSSESLKSTYARARMIRRRYTVLDFAIETGIFAECVDELFGPGGYWARRTGAQTAQGGTLA